MKFNDACRLRTKSGDVIKMHFQFHNLCWKKKNDILDERNAQLVLQLMVCLASHL